MKIFAAEDFSFLVDVDERWLTSEMANTKIEKLLGREIYGYKFGPCPDLAWRPGKFDMNGDIYTHKAYLFNVQNFKEECNKHSPKEVEGKGYGRCSKCGVIMRQIWKWEVAE